MTGLCVVVGQAFVVVGLAVVVGLVVGLNVVASRAGEVSLLRPTLGCGSVVFGI